MTPTPEFTAALEAATNTSGLTLDRFRDEASETYRLSNIRKQTVKSAVPIKSGLPDRVIEAVREELGERDDDPIQIEWDMLSEGQLFELRHSDQIIRFNLGYRAALGGDEAVAIPTLVYLLLESYFTKSRLNQVTKSQIDAWQTIASAAVLAQLGDDAYDALANWPAMDADQASPARPVIMAGPRPAPPSVALLWAHLGHRGQVSPQTEVEDVENADTPDVGRLAISTSEAQLDDLPTRVEAGHSTSPSSAPEETVLSRQQPSPPRTSSQTPALPSRAPIFVANQLATIDAQPGDREIVTMYRQRAEIERIAATLEVDARDVALRLCALVLDLRGDDIDDPGLAAMHGMPYTPDDRERIVEMYREGRMVRTIASHFNRTPFAVAWQLLSTPKRPVEVPKTLIKRIDRALGVTAGAPATNASKLTTES